MNARLWQRLRSTRTRATVGLAAVLVVATTGVWASWADTVPVSGSTVAAFTVPQATAEACQLTNSVSSLSGTFYMGLTISATVPTGNQFGYQVQLARIASPNTIIWTHQPTSLSGSTLSYVFTSADITVDQPVANDPHIDYYVYVIVQLQNSPNWQSTRTQLNVDASNSPGTLGIGAGVYYGSLKGTNSPGGQPGQCTT